MRLKLISQDNDLKLIDILVHDDDSCEICNNKINDYSLILEEADDSDRDIFICNNCLKIISKKINGGKSE